MRKYVILYRRGKGRWGRVAPGLHQGLYDRPEVNAAVVFLRDNPAAQGVAVVIGDEQFNVIATSNPDENNTFEFPA